MTFRKVLRKGFKWGLGPILKRAYGRYARKSHSVRTHSLRLSVLPGVFHPTFFISTDLFCRFLGRVEGEISGKKVLEMGSGAGLIALVAARMGAQVTACDLNPDAVACTCNNAKSNKLAIACRQSDLFSSFTKDEIFDVILVNPPFYPKNPDQLKDYAWFCGAEFEYFSRFFEESQNHLTPNGKIWMILSEDCDVGKIRGIGAEKGWESQVIWERQKWLETNWIIEYKKREAVR